ncbi:hypothetical protein [Escherichia coli]
MLSIYIIYKLIFSNNT